MVERRVERRLTAILAADLAGYSRLMGAHEELTALALREHRAAVDPIIASHGGRIVTLMIDRNVGVPEDRRMLFRIGTNLGDVLIEGDDILGDGVNIAARLESIAEPGGICISECAYHQVRGKTPIEFDDLGEQSLKNIARPVRVYCVTTEHKDGPLAVTGTRALAISATPPAAPRLSIVVLPLANLSGDPEKEYFVDGLTEDLTSELSRIQGAVVIARNTAFTYKGKPVDVKQVARDVGVRYVLEGSVRKVGKRVRVNAQLIDAETDAHLWVDRFDRDIIDLLELQDAVTIELANVLGVQLVAAEGRRG